MASNSVTVGVIGLGTQGQRHVREVQNLGADLVGGADVSPDARESFVAEHDRPVYETHTALYDKAEPDAVIVTSPNKFHEPAAVDAFERDISVLLEKPIAHTLDSAERIVSAAEDSAGIGMVGFKNRYCAAADAFISRRENGRFGDITRVEANFIRRRGAAVGTWFTNKEIAGGGALIDIGVHALDFAMYLMDYPEVVEVSGVTRSDLAGRDDYVDPNGWGNPEKAGEVPFTVDDSATAFVRTAEGALITLDVAWATNREPSQGIVVRGTEAGASMDLGGSELSINEAINHGADQFVDIDIDANIERTALTGEDADFLEAVERGEPPEINTLNEGLRIQRILDAIYESSETESAVRL
jgi:predicted dehydrogenase